MGERRGVYGDLVGKPEGKKPLVRPRRRWEYNIKMDIEEVGYNNNNIYLTAIGSSPGGSDFCHVYKKT
jgi:hypothetical protein